MFKELYQYRELLKTNVKKEIRGKYKGSFLGVLWSFINPLLMTLIYAIVFPFVLKNTQEHYVTFLIIGILPWNWFTLNIIQGTTTFLSNAGIIKKVYFPREILPISVVTSGLINFLISCIIIALFLIFSGIGFSGYIVYLPLIILAQYILMLAIIFLTSSINVYIRDAEYIINFIIQMLFYATPILYSTDLFPEKIAGLLKINPMVTIIECYRDVLFYHNQPHLKSLLIVILTSLILLLINYRIFRRLEKGFAEEV
ncbi:MAG: ABC transporter permease [Firmicutes bacterium]|nr:ABC transporter permease [Bacillota bacterium]